MPPSQILFSSVSAFHALCLVLHDLIPSPNVQHAWGQRSKLKSDTVVLQENRVEAEIEEKEL